MCGGLNSPAREGSSFRGGEHFKANGCTAQHRAQILAHQVKLKLLRPPFNLTLRKDFNMTSDFLTAEEMKAVLKLKAKEGDTRTLKKYVLAGKIIPKYFSRKIIRYKLADDNIMPEIREEWSFK